MIAHDILLIPLKSVVTDKTLKDYLAKKARVISATPVIGPDFAYMHYVLERDIPNHRPTEDMDSKPVTYSLEHLHSTEVQQYVGKYVYFADSLDDFNVPLEISILAPIYDEDDEYEDERTGFRFKYMRPLTEAGYSSQEEK